MKKKDIFYDGLIDFLCIILTIFAFDYTINVNESL